MRFGVGAGILDTTLRFDGGRRAEVEMTALSVSGAFPVAADWVARASVGVILDGFLQPQGDRQHDVEPGGLVAFGLDRQVRPVAGVIPAVDLSISLSGSWAKSVAPVSQERSSYVAADLRLGARAVWRLGGKSYPYLAARVFGGPVNWQWDGEDVQGSDVHHVQVALGTAVQWGTVGFHLEWAGLGEQGASAGLSTVW